ncbi:ABC transporter permease [Paenibacillus puldeungensis]|uniref:ABC transporter permease n=1 Tax=Paenibacillus puldeungensis TaxID=696536 RepID=A0ABW3S4L9_9BACL
MKLVASMEKTLKENVRDWKVLVMVLIFSPFFILLMNLFYGGAPTTYQVGVLNYDAGHKSAILIQHIESAAQGKDGSSLFKITPLDDQQDLETKVKDKTVDIGIVIPKDYSGKLEENATGKTKAPAVVRFYGSMGNMKYTLAAVFASDAITKQGMEVAKVTLPANIHETLLEKKQPLNEFEQYVPGTISLAVLMILFSASASIVKENDKRTLIRLKLSKLGAFHFLGGVSIVQTIIALVAIILSYWTALGLGYKPVGGFGAVLAVGIVSSFSMVAISLVVASFLNTVFDVLTIGCFPFFIQMFFTGSMFPLPKVNLFTIGGHHFGITDLLPLTHTASAFNKILNFGSGIADVSFEIFMIVLLTVFYFVLGLLLYQKRKLSKA